MVGRMEESGARERAQGSRKERPQKKENNIAMERSILVEEEKVPRALILLGAEST